MAVTGYWLLGADGSLAVHGRTPRLAARIGPTVLVDAADPVVGMAATPDGRGYWTVTGLGVVRAFGVAEPLGEPGPEFLVEPVVAITATPDGTGYWLLTRRASCCPTAPPGCCRRRGRAASIQPRGRAGRDADG